MSKKNATPSNANRMVHGDPHQIFISIPYGANGVGEVEVRSSLLLIDETTRDDGRGKVTEKQLSKDIKEAVEIAKTISTVAHRFGALAWKRITLALARYLMVYGGETFNNNPLQFVAVKACERIRADGYQSDAIIDLGTLSHGCFGGKVIWIVRDRGSHMYFANDAKEDTARCIADFGTKHYADENCEIFVLQTLDPRVACVNQVTAEIAASIYRSWIRR